MGMRAALCMRMYLHRCGCWNAAAAAAAAVAAAAAAAADADADDDDDDDDDYVMMMMMINGEAPTCTRSSVPPRHIFFIPGWDKNIISPTQE